MCGLFGYAKFHGNLEADLARLDAARDTLTHRGPDQAGEWHDDQVYLGHRRLSILDLSEAGRQPMISDDGNIIITVNGEIYNFQALRQELQKSGAIFKSGSDSEVVLHGYAQWGIDALLDKIDGMYAIILYDLKAGRLLIARDRAGIKPVYYSLFSDGLAWASELKALTAFHGVENLAWDQTALYDFLTYRYIPAPKTAYQNVCKLPPAHLLTVDVATGQITTRRYWQVPTGNRDLRPDAAAQELRELIAESVAEQMVADVPVGFFLSGGIDSSTIVAQAMESSADLHTFTIGFGVEEHDEMDYAATVAAHCKTRHNVKIIDANLDVPFAEWMQALYDEPFGDSSALPTWYVAAFAREKVTVALSGDGGDELFGGYKRYEELGPLYRKLKWLRFIPQALLKGKWTEWKKLDDYAAIMKKPEPLLELLSLAYISKIPLAVKQEWRSKLGIPDTYDELWFYKQHWKPELGLRKALQYLDFHCYLPEDILTKVDRATMAHHLEARVPLLSRKLIEFAFQLPESFIYKDGKLKGGLKYAFRDKLPAQILHRGKQGFSVPWQRWREQLVQKQTLPEALLSNFMKGK